jgi:hypothetical protein
MSSSKSYLHEYGENFCRKQHQIPCDQKALRLTVGSYGFLESNAISGVVDETGFGCLKKAYENEKVSDGPARI